MLSRIWCRSKLWRGLVVLLIATHVVVVVVVELAITEVVVVHFLVFAAA